MKRYYTDFSNEVHQLIITPSKHYYISSDGRFKFQHNPFDVSLKNCNSQKKSHVIHYLIRDHFSGVFHWEICDAGTPIPIYEFLYRAWRKTDPKEFHGLPEAMTVPKNTQAFFPGVIKFIEGLGIKYIEVTSGFQGGVRDIKTIEESLKLVGAFIDRSNFFDINPPFDSVLDYAPTFCKQLAGDYYKKPSKTDKWLSGIDNEKKLLIPKSLDQFKKLYQENEN